MSTMSDGNRPVKPARRARPRRGLPGLLDRLPVRRSYLYKMPDGELMDVTVQVDDGPSSPSGRWAVVDLGPITVRVRVEM